MKVWSLGVILCLGAASASAQEALAPSLAAKFMNIISTSDGGDGRVACAPGEMAQELGKAGVKVDDGGTFAWANNPGELAAFQKQGKIVVVGSMDLLKAGAPLALVAQGGRPAVFISGPGRTNPRIPSAVKKIARNI